MRLVLEIQFEIRFDLIDCRLSKMFSFLRSTMRSHDVKSLEEGSVDVKSSTPMRDKVFAALFYGVVSLAVIFTNKSIMSQHKFPHFDFLATVQFAATTVILSTLVFFKKVDIPMLTPSIARDVLPISVMFLGNVICGLGSTRSLNLPMFTALRRFSILMTMIAEYLILGNNPRSPIVISVAMMVGGAMIAAFYDFTYDTEGYMLVFLNNLFTTLNGVWMKKASISGKCSKMGVLYYNSLFSALFMLLFFAVEHYMIDSDNAGSDAADLIKASVIASASTGVANAGAGVGAGVGVGGSGSSSMAVSLTSDHLHKLHADALGHARALSALAVGAAASAIAGNLGQSIDAGAASVVGGGVRGAAAAAVGAKDGKQDLISSKVKHSIDIHHELPSIHDFESKLSAVSKFPGWQQWDFCLLFSVAVLMGTVLNYSIFLCTTLNSALTTAVVGCLKNVATTYIGMIFLSDYEFNWMNFIGLNISILGSLYYTYVTLWKGLQGYGGG